MAFASRWGLACAALVLIGVAGTQGFLSPAAAQGQTVAPSAPAAPVPASYYIEFRAADVGVYGHSYIAFGRLGPGGKPATVQYADFHPEGGMLGLAVGHVLPVAADMTPEKETLTLPITASFRRKITAAQYKKVQEAIKTAHANNHVWSALAYNCNTFVGDVAEAIGMKTPTSILFSTAYIPALRFLNETPAEASANARAAAPRNSAARAAAPKRSQQVAPAREPST
jgi:hypothetical protein